MSVIKDSPIFATANNATVTVTNATNVSVLASGGSVTIRTADLEIISASGSINGYITYFK